MISLFTFISAAAKEELQVAEEPQEIKKDPSFFNNSFIEKDSEGQEKIISYESKAIEILLKSDNLAEIVFNAYGESIEEVKKLMKLKCKNEKKEEKKLDQPFKNLFFFCLKKYLKNYIEAKNYYLLDSYAILIYKIIVQLFIENKDKFIEDEDLKKLNIDIDCIMPDLYFNYEHLPNVLKDNSENEHIKKLPEKYKEKILKILTQKGEDILGEMKDALPLCQSRIEKVLNDFIIKKKNDFNIYIENFKNILKNFKENNLNDKLKKILNEKNFPLDHNFYFNENEEYNRMFKEEKNETEKNKTEKKRIIRRARIVQREINKKVYDDKTKANRDLMKDILDSFKKIKDDIESGKNIDQINVDMKNFNKQMDFIFWEKINITNSEEKTAEELTTITLFETLMETCNRVDINIKNDNNEKRQWFTIFNKDFQNAINFLQTVSEYTGSLGFSEDNIKTFLNNFGNQEEIVVYEKDIDGTKIQIKTYLQDFSFQVVTEDLDEIFKKKIESFLESFDKEGNLITYLNYEIENSNIDLDQFINKCKEIDTDKIAQFLTTNTENLKSIKTLDIDKENKTIDENNEIIKKLEKEIEENTNKKLLAEKESEKMIAEKHNKEMQIQNLKYNLKKQEKTDINVKILKNSKEIKLLEEKIIELTKEVTEYQTTVKNKKQEKNHLDTANKKIRDTREDTFKFCKYEIINLFDDIEKIKKITKDSIKDQTVKLLKIKEAKFANIINELKDVITKENNYKKTYKDFQNIQEAKNKIPKYLWKILEDKIFIKNGKEIKFNDTFLKQFKDIQKDSKDYGVNLKLEKKDLKTVFKKFINEFKDYDQWKKIGSLGYFNENIQIMNLCKDKNILKIKDLNAENLEKFGQELKNDEKNNQIYYNYLKYFDDFLKYDNDGTILFIDPEESEILEKNLENPLTATFWSYNGLRKCIKNIKDNAKEFLKKSYFSYYGFLETEHLNYTSNVNKKAEEIKKDLCENGLEINTTDLVVQNYINYEIQNNNLKKDMYKFENIKNIEMHENFQEKKLNTILKKENIENIDNDLLKDDQTPKKIMIICGIVILCLLSINIIKSYEKKKKKKGKIKEKVDHISILGVLL